MLAFWRVLNANCLYLLHLFHRFPFLMVDMLFNCPLAKHGGICNLNKQQFSTSQQTLWTVAVYACSLCERLTKTGGQTSCYMQTSSFFSRWNLKNDFVLVSHLKKQFFFQKMVYTMLKTGYYKSRVNGGTLWKCRTFRNSSKWELWMPTSLDQDWT